MAREIKFRAWDKDQKITRQVDGINFNEFGFSNFKAASVACSDNNGDNTQIIRLTEVELMQYTGMTDSDGQEIFEGDIIRIRESEYDEWSVHSVEYHGDKGYPAFELNPLSDEECNGLSYVDARCRVEVIGNIYEHPHLLAKKENGVKA